jgi:hypothetical protein
MIGSDAQFEDVSADNLVKNRQKNWSQSYDSKIYNASVEVG